MYCVLFSVKCVEGMSVALLVRHGLSMLQLKEFEAEAPLILFSGDAFNPSILSIVTKVRVRFPCASQVLSTCHGFVMWFYDVIYHHGLSSWKKGEGFNLMRLSSRGHPIRVLLIFITMLFTASFTIIFMSQSCTPCPPM